MKIRPRLNLLSLLLMITLLSSSFFVTPQSQANFNSNTNVNIRVFFDALSPFGVWVNHPIYGEVWYPNDVSPDWRPYTDGYWANTDEYGWLWVANEPWGWAPFHYGRWAWDGWYGWIWVPGNVWAPAWVFWRTGDGYAAWSPMPPNVVWQPGVGLNISYFDYDRDLPWDSWIIVRDYDLPRRQIREHIFPSRENREIINGMHNTHNLSWNHNTIVNEGIPVKEIETITRQPIEHFKPTVHDRIIDLKNRHGEGQPDIIQLPMAGPSSQEIMQNEELARRLDGKRPDGTRTEQLVTPSIQPNNQDTRLPGRLVGIHRQPSESMPVQSLQESHPVSLPEAVRQVGSPDITAIPIMQPNSHPLVSTQHPLVDQQQFDRLPRQQPVRSQQEAEQQQQMQLLQQQAERAQQEAVQQQQLQESARQQEAQQQQMQMQLQRQQAERTQKEAVQQQQQQLQESARQQEAQQQQMQIQRQQAERTQQEAVQQQLILESARQQEAQQQQQMQLQRQQAERAQQEAVQQQQLQESARQQEAQQQQQMQLQRQQAERAQQEAVQQQQQLQESARQQEAQQQQQMQLQRQQAERAQQEAVQQQQQLQDSARQQEAQRQQQAERARKEAEQRDSNVGGQH